MNPVLVSVVVLVVAVLAGLGLRVVVDALLARWGVEAPEAAPAQVSPPTPAPVVQVPGGLPTWCTDCRAWHLVEGEAVVWAAGDNFELARLLWGARGSPGARA